MAVTVSDRSTKITLRIEDTTDNFSNRIINNINPGLSDDKARYCGEQIATLLLGDLDYVKRDDTFTLNQE